MRNQQNDSPIFTTLFRTLSFLYIPLGGNKKGSARRFANLLTTMLLGGLWHGAGWTFVVWGFMHGMFLVTNHAWLTLKKRIPYRSTILTRSISWSITFFSVVAAWVVFRANTMEDAFVILKGMMGFNGFDPLNIPLMMGDKKLFIVLALYVLIALVSKNSQEFFGKYYLDLQSTQKEMKKTSLFAWKPNLFWAIIMGGIAIIALLCSTRVNEFIYFNF
jgi:hypothetical protein